MKHIRWSYRVCCIYTVFEKKTKTKEHLSVGWRTENERNASNPGPVVVTPLQVLTTDALASRIQRTTLPSSIHLPQFWSYGLTESRRSAIDSSILHAPRLQIRDQL
jgi:hypothetical protein